MYPATAKAGAAPPSWQKGAKLKRVAIYTSHRMTDFYKSRKTTFISCSHLRFRFGNSRLPYDDVENGMSKFNLDQTW